MDGVWKLVSDKITGKPQFPIDNTIACVTRWPLMVIVVAIAILGTHAVYGDPTVCDIPDNKAFNEKDIRNIKCDYAQSLYIDVNTSEQNCMQTNYNPTQAVHLEWYRWVPILMLVHAALIITPYIIRKKACASRLVKIITNVELMGPESAKTTGANLYEYKKTYPNGVWNLVVGYYCSPLAILLFAGINLLFANHYLKGKFVEYGFTIISSNFNFKEVAHPYFPLEVCCIANPIIKDGTVNLKCTSLWNIYHSFLYAFLWFTIMIQLLVGLLGLVIKFSNLFTKVIRCRIERKFKIKCEHWMDLKHLQFILALQSKIDPYVVQGYIEAHHSFKNDP